MYQNSLKKKLCEEICIRKKSTSKTAEAYSIPLKTLEKWITAYRKDQHCFDETAEADEFEIIEPPKKANIYDDMSNEELKNLLMKKDIELARLKKGYQVKGVGLENKVYVTFSKKNMK